MMLRKAEEDMIELEGTADIQQAVENSHQRLAILGGQVNELNRQELKQDKSMVGKSSYDFGHMLEMVKDFHSKR